MADVIKIILKDLNVHDVHSALLVNREWCRAAVPMYWRAPFSFTQKRSMTALKIYGMFLEQGSTSTQSEVQRVQPFFDYPSFIKELHYTNLLACEETYSRAKKVEAILQMLVNREIRLETFIMKNTGANNERIYGLWATPCYASIFSTLIHVEIHTPFPKNNVIKSLAKNCTRLSHLDINLFDTSDERAKESINYLKELISAQQCPLNLRLVFPNGLGNMLIKTFQPRLESFQRLELVKWNFSGCDWSWLNDCPNLTEFAITSPCPPQVSRILGTNYETHRMKPSKNSKIVTEHWHLDKSDEISPKQKFYFHSDRSLIVPYGGEPPTIIQPKVHRTIPKEKLTQYMFENLFRAMEKLHREDEDERDYDSCEYDYDDYDDEENERGLDCYDGWR